MNFLEFAALIGALYIVWPFNQKGKPSRSLKKIVAALAVLRAYLEFAILTTLEESRVKFEVSLELRNN